MSISTPERESADCEPADILITSFVPWLAHQKSNSSDDLIAMIQSQHKLPVNSVWLRHVPVCFDLAPALVIPELQRLRPRVVVCCGMAENRPCLSVEKQAVGKEQTLQTAVDVQTLLENTLQSEVSYDAGRYVCNHLYYQVLAAIEAAKLDTIAIFVHVPILTDENRAVMLSDFLQIASALLRQTQMTQIE
ncbi:peptidase C15 [cf. Phormidesmis sp. LEGE 11477]|uniref:pyroglutamyl-peptidase I family protein n=1 Tax=cf. Phormidesmis sp. LEGE 11477 TaxID=1828680 RepID=UPI001882141D|nr:peptidase C15 [cf. Phormidesmis sp. LEGE 11477]MBE9064420.1 peptidase C15 [cf. Phormidesmis sp. LEGE 11477]